MSRYYISVLLSSLNYGLRSGLLIGIEFELYISKVHGGEIKVETKVDEGNPDKFGKGEGSKFIIQLPIT